MADIAATDVTYTMRDQQVTDSSFKKNIMTVAFGDGALTYPAGGIPLTSGKMGVPNFIAALEIFSPAANGYLYKYNASTNKIQIYQSAALTPAGTNDAPAFTGSALAAHSHELFVATGGTDAAGSRVNSVSGKFGMADAAVTHAGIPAASGAAGGVVDITAGTPAGTVAAPVFTGDAIAAAALDEVASGSFAPAATTLYIEVEGW